MVAAAAALTAAPQRARLAFLVLMAVASAAYFLLPTGSVVQALAFVSLAWLPAVLVAIRAAAEPTEAGRWAVLAMGAIVYAIASTGWALLPVALGESLPYPSLVDAIYFIAYAFYAAFLFALIRPAATDGRGTLGSVLEAVALASAGGLLIQRELIEPVLGAAGELTPAVVTSVAYPVVLIALLGLGTQLAFVKGLRSRSDILVATWIGGELVGAALYASLSLEGAFTYGHPTFLAWMVSYAALGLFALEPTPEPEPRVVRQPVAPARRLIFLAVATAVPVAVVLESAGSDSPFLGTYAVWLGLTVGLVLFRMFLLTREVESERALRERVEELAAELEFGATHDPLTSLLNRAALGDALRRGRARRGRGAPVAIILLDLDGFKAVNDTFGHATGDDVLREVARRLHAVVRESDATARLGGDEFAIVAEGLEVPEALALGDRIVAALTEPVVAGPIRAALGVSVGIYALQPGDSETTALRNADAAMYAAKAAGGGVHVFDARSHGRYIERHELTLQLRAAAAAGQLVVHYQPVVELEGRVTVGAEALVRWQHPTRGLMGPTQFIDLAEDSGAIVEVGRWVLEQACRDAAGWRAAGPGWADLGVAVNVSRRQLRAPSITDDVASALAASGLPPGLLTIEVTESALMAETDEMIAVLGRIKSLGVQVAMDDFGVGYSSLAQLRRLPIDVLKIDRAFVSGIARDDEEWALSSAIVRLATRLGRTTLAEGVEHASQLAHLRALGVRLAQGYLFSPPVPLAEFLELPRHRVHAGYA